DAKINANNTTIINKVDKNIDVKINENNKQINNKINEVNVKVDGVKGDLNSLTKRVDRHDQRLDYLQGNIVDNSTRITVVEDGVKANAKDINVVGTIAMENRQFIGDNKVAIANNTKNININAKAIDELKGQVGQSSTVINDIKKQ
ncbi:MAG: hypothetical protein Q620_VSAC00784G0001, partial [Veillonella sp. DORA_A_3_16_22]